MNVNDVLSNIQKVRFNISDYSIDFHKFSQDQYFTVIPSSNFKFFLPVILLGFSLLALGGFLFWFNKKKIGFFPPKNAYLKKLFLTCQIYGLAFLAILFFRYERIPTLSTRLFAIIFFLICLLWLGYLGYFYIQKLPLQIRKYESWLLKQKYLPKSKKRRR